jgi:thiol:disulfide interchange protein DsbA
MKRYLIPALLAAFALTACNGNKEETAAAPAAATTEAPADDAATMAAAEAAAQASANPDATATDPAAPDAATTGVAPAPAVAAGEIPGLRVGTDYEIIKGGQPYQPLAGKIEVVELFGYTCGHCATFEPAFAAWKNKQSADVRVTLVPAAFGGYWEPFARAYYAAEMMGVVEKSHASIFKAIHLDRSIVPGEDLDPLKIGALYAPFGVDAKQFANAMKSFGVQGKYSRARQFAAANGLDGTPILVVNGKYRVRGASEQDMLRIVDALVAHERAQGAAPPAP